MNKLYIGLKRDVVLPKKGGLIVIADELNPKWRGKKFDPLKHSFNPLAGLDYRKACELVDIIGAMFPGGDETLTKTTGLEFIAEALEGEPTSLDGLIPEPDKKSSTGHIWAYGKIRRILRSPVLKRMLCNPTNFSFNPRSVILARVNRAELGEFDATVIGLLLMSQFKGQLVVSDLGFYGRDLHTGLLRENRLIAGVGALDELPPKLRRLVSTTETVAAGATYEDAERLAMYAGKLRGTNDFNDFVAEACG
jgi:hypothetical protein